MLSPSSFNTMTVAHKKISIIVLTYNRRRLLQDCLQSLLVQTYPQDQLEIVVSDDGSTDGTHELIESLLTQYPHIRYFYQPHRGIAAARNNGIVHATGAIVAIVADDYILDATYATTIADFFFMRPEAMVVRFKVIAAQRTLGSRISHFYYDTSVRRRLSRIADPPPSNWRERLAQTWQKMRPHEETITTQHDLEAAGAAAFRREVFSRAGFFDESLQRAEDTDMTIRLRELGIAVHYYPHLHIKHQYSPFLLDTLLKCFRSGFNRYKLYQKHAFDADTDRSVARNILRDLMGTTLATLGRARQGESTAEIIFYLPFVLLFEATNKLGFLCSFLSDRLRSRKRPRQHETEDECTRK